MSRLILVLMLAAFCCATAGAQTMTLSTSNNDYVITNAFSDVDIFSFEIEIAAPLAAGAYVDPTINTVTYQVMGTLAPGTPSDFPAFDLQRSITGTEFYEQGSSLSFEIAASAVLTDGVQVAELVGGGIVLTLNAMEIDTGRFHPPLFELDANGTGSIQNSTNTPSLNPRVDVPLGAEYITDLTFDPGNTTILVGPAVQSPPPRRSGNGSLNPLVLVMALVLTAFYARKKRRHGAESRTQQ